MAEPELKREPEQTEHAFADCADDRRVAKITRCAVRYRDGQMIVMNVLRRECVQLRRAGFRAYPLILDRDDQTRVESDLWMQDRPTLADYLNAAHLLFDNEPGSVYWDESR